MKIRHIVIRCCILTLIGSAAAIAAELESLPEFTLTDQDRDRLRQLHNLFRAEMASAQTVEARKSAIVSFWENHTLPPPAAQTDAERKVAIETTVLALFGGERPISYAVRDAAAEEIDSMQEREALFVKSGTYMALISDPERLGRHIPLLLESRKDRASFSRDDHFSVLVIREFLAHCVPVVSLTAQELSDWKSLANAPNAACRLAAVIAVGNVTASSSDIIAVFSETADEGETAILSVIIKVSTVLPDNDRHSFLQNLKDNNNALSPEQIALIDSILE